MAYNDFYSVKLRKTITIPTSKITTRTIKGRKFLVGKYSVDGKMYEAWKITK